MNGKSGRLDGLVGWGIALGAGAGVGSAAGLLAGRTDQPAFWMALPFVMLLACIAVMPLAARAAWHRFYPHIALFLGGLAAGLYCAAFRDVAPGHSIPHGAERVLHSLEEYISFIALVGGLYVVSGGILIEVKGRGGPVVNTAILAIGAVLANIVGTTGASMLLIRPFMRVNQGRLTRTHVVFFIFIVSNCGGCLTPIGDPPLYLGYLKGVPFFWTADHLWKNWLVVCGGLLLLFYLMDRRSGPGAGDGPVRVSIRGGAGVVCLGLMVVGVFIPPACKAAFGFDGFLIGAGFQAVVAAASYFFAPREVLGGNAFTFAPLKEVGLLFAGIFLTMAPALSFLGAHGTELGLRTAAEYYFGTGSLSAVLDNAPTYASFLQLALGPGEIGPVEVARFLASPGGGGILAAIATGAVFFGAMTYIGNGPNFMVKAVAEAHGVHMPGFLGYFVRACLILLPVLVLHALIFIR